uniref:Sterile alpha motif domain containing 13 n=1 Tax=Cyprinus carpio carpio TaxID=630221 RepID=A0A9J8CFY2_CYPCA
METKENGSVDTKSSVENGQLSDPAHWAVADVVNYFKATGFEEQANAFQDQKCSDILSLHFSQTFLERSDPRFSTKRMYSNNMEIDGKSLLLMTRNDVLTGLSIKLGPALKIYEYHVKPLQTQHLKSNVS